MAQPTVSFDAEDLPPPSYYQRVKENGPLIGVQTTSLQCPSEGTNSDSSDDAPLMTHGKVKTVQDIGASIDKSEWWKAPEFIPRSLQTVPDGEAPLSEDICAPTVPYDCVESDQALFSHESYGDLDRSLADRLSMSTPILTPPHSIGIPRLLDARPAPAATFFPVPVWTQNQRPIAPLVPPHMFPLRINPTTAAAAAAALSLKSAANSVPAGYSANFTTLNAGLGPPIPAIVLKKKRKKKNRKLKGLSLTDIKDDEDDRLALLNGNNARTDRASSCGSTGDGQSLSKSEMDMIGVQEQQDCVEVIQNGPLQGAADACSCPDLTEAQRRQLLDEFNAQMEHFEMQSNPVVRQTLQELLVDEGKGGAGIRSPRVKELDQQILKEMQRQWQSEGKRYPIAANQGGQEQSESSECTDLYSALTSDFLDSANGKGDHFRGQPVKSIREEIEEKTFFQHRPQWRSLNADIKPNGNMPLSTVVQYQAGSFVTEVNSDNPSASLITKKLSRLIPRATFVEEEMADDEGHMFINSADSEEIDFPNVRQTVYPYQALPTNDTRQTVVLQRRHSIPDTMEPFFKRKTRVCCVLM